MPPTVDSIERSSYGRPYFCIDLEGAKEFDAALFDEQANEVISAIDDSSKAGLKFVVVGSRVAIFGADVMHVDAYMNLLDPDKYDGKLMCGGMVTAREDRRSIWGNSSSLRKYRGLEIEASDTFKNTVLQSALGEHFQIR